jgi:hypothetical protein
MDDEERMLLLDRIKRLSLLDKLRCTIYVCQQGTMGQAQPEEERGDRYPGSIFLRRLASRS